MKLAISLALAAAATFAAPFASAQTGPTDPQIVGIVIGANQIDIDHAKLALSKTHNQQVREFAQQMITDHTAVLKSVHDLGAKLHVTPAESDTATGLKKQADETTAHLKTLSGAEFDKAYVDTEVAYHKAVIQEVSTVLIPGAQNAELKSALQGAAPLFQGHLEHAEHLQSSMNGH